MRAKQRMGLLGGSFDPIHFGHLHLAIALSEAHQLDQVIFCPTSLSPFKKDYPPKASKEDRKRMVDLAIKPISSFSLLSTEIDREGISYTIETIKDVLGQLHAKGEEVDLFLMLGEDALTHFHQWKDVEQIVHLAPPLTGSRLIDSFSFLDHFSGEIQRVISQGITPIPVMQISSTLIRQRLLSRRFCGHLVPQVVLEHIHNNKLYLE